ncbi:MULTISPECIES: DUF397 domain-containing protein [Amycolatopsis]|uniref:DUF397 domain-containing protein n=3 Tax=Amycolatopsis TaxID=1813 RepID=A0A1I6BHY7_9PSEU|nr:MULTISPECIES: DUF397 domain-containing protein [Amycolatopsis]MBB1153650.1 DUF397 domain-containing protein [Amycolatopsis dendrobii]MCG3756215.1 DUF397 domain-containing protein [Amycolatopsis sp. Poz14]MYW93391.1 DUF397 domain-containing protein [Amycolatopsis rubida]NEC58378.1 DUF397 domain-containing protein [Amycolatopsis rubida]OAP20201.1 hypothetical protein A4R44_09047 [Amycolatopsis sp. M39]
MMADLSGAQWRKSSYSGGGNDCVEVAFVAGGAAVRDSKDPEGGAFRLPAAGWQALLDAVRGQGQA